MGMFDNYGNDSYTAYNLTPPSISRGILTNFKTPLYTRNSQGNIDRFLWVEGEHFDLKINAKMKVRVPKGSIIFYESGEKPISSTMGKVGLKCYNVIDYISWTLTAINKTPDGNNVFEWTKDNLFECLQSGGEEVELSPFMKDGSFEISILNFRREVMYEFSTDDSTVEIPINDEETPELKQGQYFIDLFVVDSDSHSYFVDEYEVSILGNIDRIADYIKTSNYYADIKTIHGEECNYEWYPIEGPIETDFEWHGITEVE